MTIKNEKLIAPLLLAGLNETEAKIYLACLEMGPSSAWNIFKKTGVKRPTCYASLDKLVADEIAHKKFDGARSIFSVITPAKLLMTLDYRKNQFRKALPLFAALKSTAEDKPRVQVFEGLDGIHQAYILGLDQPENSEILVFGSARIWQEINQQDSFYTAERVSKNITSRALFANLPHNQLFAKMDRMELRETRYLPQEYFDPKTEIQVFDNTVIYVTYSETAPYATVIENQAIAADMRQQFEILWKLSH